MNLVILERDGVINEALPGHVRSTDEWLPIPGSLDAVARLGRAGCRVVVATRQPGIRRRHLTIEDLNRIHELMYRRLAEYGGAIDAVFMCLCLPRHDCECFKPRPSVLHEIAERLHVSLDGVPCVGASPEFLDTAHASGARPMRVRTGKGKAAVRGGVARDEMDVNYFGTMEMCRRFGPVLGGNGGGAIVNMLSILSRVNLPMIGTYCASKAATLSLTQGVRAELAAQGTLVVAVMPGAIDTRMGNMNPPPLEAPIDVANAALDAVEAGEEDIYPGVVAGGVAQGLAADPKGVEKQFAAYLPG